MDFNGIGTAAGGSAVPIALYIIWMLVKQIRNKRNGTTLQNNKIEDELDEIKADVTWIKDIHNRFTPDGNPVWYFPDRLETMLKKLIESNQETNGRINKLTMAVENLVKTKN